MRDYLDSILALINSESLTDEEFDSLPEDVTAAYTRETFLGLRAVLEARENVTDEVFRLKSLFLSKGIDLRPVSSIPTPQSEIFIGSVL